MSCTDCKGCNFMRADVHHKSSGGYYCINQDSPNFGKEAIYGCSEYEKFNPRPDMSFKDALDMIVMHPHGAYSSYYYLFGREDDFHRPMMCISFETNKQMEKYKEALLVCFDKLMDMKKEDGDFKEGTYGDFSIHKERANK